jgi:hypothetical protein
MNVKVGVSFQGRPQIDTHAYQFYDMDPASGMMLASKGKWTYLYNPATRLWEWPPVPAGAGAVRSVPGGALGSGSRNDAGKVMRFDAKARQWVDLPAGGDKLPGMSINYTGWCHDSKRDCMWFFAGGVYQYDLKTGNCSRKRDKIAPAELKGYPQECLYVPELDKVLFCVASEADPEAFSVWDPENLKWLKARIPLSEADGAPAKGHVAAGANASLVYDPAMKLFLGNNSGTVWALRLDAATLKFEDGKE